MDYTRYKYCNWKGSKNNIRELIILLLNHQPKESRLSKNVERLRRGGDLKDC